MNKAINIILLVVFGLLTIIMAFGTFGGLLLYGFALFNLTPILPILLIVFTILDYILILGLMEIGPFKFKKKEKVIDSPEIQPEYSDPVEETIQKLDDLLVSKQLSDYPNLENILTEITEYLVIFQKKHYLVNKYILESINEFLRLLLDVIDTPYKNNPKGIKLIENLTEAFSLIEKTLDKIYGNLLEGKKQEAEALVTALKGKLSMDNLNITSNRSTLN